MARDNSKITFKGAPLTIVGKALKVGEALPTVTLTAQDMSDVSTSKFSGKPLLVSTVPSLDTPVCSIETRRFNQEASKLGDKVTILTISRDLPFAQKRWCAAEGATNLQVASDFKTLQTGQAFGVHIQEWALLTRAIFVADAQGKLTYVEYVDDVSSEPNYENALKALAATLE